MFFLQYMLKKGPIFICVMSFERYLHEENNSIFVFEKYCKLALLETKNFFLLVIIVSTRFLDPRVAGDL